MNALVSVLFTIQDLKAQQMSSPFCARTVQEGLRTFTSMMADEQMIFHKFPQDFRLFRCGEFNHETGEIKSYVPVMVEEGKVFGEVLSMKKVKEG